MDFIPRILLVEDEPAVRFGLSRFLTNRGYRVSEAASCQEAIDQLETVRPHVALLDYQLPDGDALTLIDRLKQIKKDLRVVVLTGHGSIPLAVQAVKEGAEDFLTKPVELATLEAVVRSCLADDPELRSRSEGGAAVAGEIDPFLGTSRAIRELRDLAHRVAAAERPILILGETGTGKGVLARWLHRHSPCRDREFVELNCAGLSRELLASELFGHAKGAFTGAVQAKPGLFETADGGTLFLDEIGDMDLSVQPHLLTVLEEQTFRRLGEVQVRSANVRLIAATHQNLAQLSREKAFRSDLYYRISTLPLSLPPLRERREDIPQLVRTMLARMADASGREVPEISPQALERLTNHPWPGNIRELRNTLERAFWLMRGSQLQESDLRFDVDGESEPLVVNLNHLTMEEMERRHIEAVLEREKGSVSRAAKALDVPRSSLYKKIRKYNIERSE